MRHDIETFKNDTFQLTILYKDALGTPVALDSTSGKTKMSIRPLNDNTSVPVISIITSTTSTPSASSVFYFPAGYTNRTILFIPQAVLEAAAGTAPNYTFGNLNVGQRYYYDIVTTRSGTTITDRVLHGYFTLDTGIVDY